MFPTITSKHDQLEIRLPAGKHMPALGETISLEFYDPHRILSGKVIVQHSDNTYTVAVPKPGATA